MQGIIRRGIDTCLQISSDLQDKALIRHRRNTEIKKFKDARRVKIYNSVELTASQKEEIDDFYLSNYGEKIPYIWHQYYTAFTGRFDATYIPELIYIPEFEYFMNPYQEYVLTIGDKNVLPYIAKNIELRTPKSILSSSRGFLRDFDNRPINQVGASDLLKNIGDVFIKPTVDSSSGQGCCICNFQNGLDTISGQSVESILSRMGRDYVVQERVICHESISRLYSKSVNTFRIITYRWKNEIKHFPMIMRIGSNGGFLDNAHAGGMFIAIEDNGILHDKAFTEFRSIFSEHPDTKIRFNGYSIPLVSNALKKAIDMHVLMPQIGLINWDFTINKEGEVVLIEANTKGGSVWLMEIAHGCGALGSSTAEVLQWMRKMKKLKKSKRYPYYWGLE